MSSDNNAIVDSTLAEVYDKILPQNIEVIQDLPKPARKAVVRTLSQDQGYSYRQLARSLGLSSATIKEYLDSEIDDREKRFLDATRKYFNERHARLENLAVNVLEDKLIEGKKESLRDVTQLFKVLMESRGVTRSSATPTGNIMTINVNPAVNRSSDNK